MESDNQEKFLVCPLTLEVMQDPVIATDGFTYEREAIQSWLKRNMKSPMTNETMPSDTLIPNFAIKSQIAAYIQKTEQSKELQEEAMLKEKIRAYKLYSELSDIQKEAIDKAYENWKKTKEAISRSSKREWNSLPDSTKFAFLKQSRLDVESYSYLTAEFKSFVSFETQIIRHNLKDSENSYPSNETYWNKSDQQLHLIELYLNKQKK